jgi:aspartate aminotransferase
MKDRNLFPLFDAAYLGFNSGNIDDDAFAIRYFVDVLEMEVAVCISFAKNMGLYGECPCSSTSHWYAYVVAGERVGCVVMVTNSPEIAARTQSTLEMIQRSEVSPHIVGSSEFICSNGKFI